MDNTKKITITERELAATIGSAIHGFLERENPHSVTSLRAALIQIYVETMTPQFINFIDRGRKISDEERNAASLEVEHELKINDLLNDE